MLHMIGKEGLPILHWKPGRRSACPGARFVRLGVSGILALSTGVWLCGCAEKTDCTRTLRMAHPLDVAHPVHQAAEFMQRRLAEESNGRIRLEIRPNSQLGSSRECIEQSRWGSLI